MKEKIINQSKNNTENMNLNIKQNNSEIIYLLVNRWVGIDGVMAVISKEKILSFDLFLKSFKKKRQRRKKTL